MDGAGTQNFLYLVSLLMFCHYLSYKISYTIMCSKTNANTVKNTMEFPQKTKNGTAL